MFTKTKKWLLFSFLVIVTFIVAGCENEKDSPTKPLTPSNYGVIEGTVYFLGTSSTIPGVLVTCGDVSATTSEDGTFILRNVPAGFQILKASKNDFNPYARNVDVVENTTTRYDIEMTAASTNKSIRGTVYQKDNLQPISNVRVILVTDTTFTDAFGKYQLPIVSQGLKTIVAEKSGYASFSGLVFISNNDLQYDMLLEKLP